MTSIENVNKKRALPSQCAGLPIDLGPTTTAANPLTIRPGICPGNAVSSHHTKKLTQYDMHRLLIDAAEETTIDWPRFFDWKPTTIVRELSLPVVLVAALVGFAILCWDGLGYIFDNISFPTLK